MAGEERELAQELFGGKAVEQSAERSMGAMEAAGLGIGIAVGALFEGVGMAVEGAANVIYSGEMQHLAEHGAHELAAALFGNGHPFVMYPGDGPKNEGQEQSQAMSQEGFPRIYEASGPEPSQEVEHQRGGRGM